MNLIHVRYRTGEKDERNFIVETDSNNIAIKKSMEALLQTYRFAPEEEKKRMSDISAYYIGTLNLSSLLDWLVYSVDRYPDKKKRIACGDVVIIEKDDFYDFCT